MKSYLNRNKSSFPALFGSIFHYDLLHIRDYFRPFSAFVQIADFSTHAGSHHLFILILEVFYIFVSNEAEQTTYFDLNPFVWKFLLLLIGFLRWGPIVLIFLLSESSFMIDRT